MRGMDFGSSTVAFLIGFILVAVYLFKRRDWNRQTNEQLVAKAAGDDWAHWKNALLELQRRGEDVQAYVPRIATRLVSNSIVEREAARLTLSDLFPDWEQQLAASGYASTLAPQDARVRLQGVFSHFQLPPP
jgi:hypothetical protein